MAGDDQGEQPQKKPQSSLPESRDELMQRGRAFSERVRTEGTISGEELEQRFDAWRDKHRRGPRKQVDPAQRVRVIAVVGAGAILVATALGMSLHLDSRVSQIQSTQAQTQELASELARLPAHPEEDRSLEQSLDELLDGADAQAREVVKAQNTFADLRWEASKDEGRKDGTPSAAANEEAEHRKTMAQLLDPSQFLVEDELAYQWGTATLFDPVEELDPRWPWFERFEGEKTADPKSWSWRVSSIDPQIDTAGDGSKSARSAHVVFVAEDSETDQVLAFAEADYEPDAQDRTTGLFTNVVVTDTVAGVEQKAPANEDVPQTPLDQLAEGAGENEEDGS